MALQSDHFYTFLPLNEGGTPGSKSMARGLASLSRLPLGVARFGAKVAIAEGYRGFMQGTGTRSKSYAVHAPPMHVHACKWLCAYRSGNRQ